MKHYLDKLNAKPKLKKCLKILSIIGICLSVVFNGLIIGVAIAQRVSASTNNDKPIQQTIKPIKKQGEYQRDYIFGIGDIATPQFLYNVITHYGSNGFSWIMPDNTTYGTITIQNQYNLLDTYYSALNGSNSQFIVSVNKITIEKNFWNAGSTDNTYGNNLLYTITMYSVSGNKIMDWHYNYYGNINWQGHRLDVNWIMTSGASRYNGFTGNLFVENLDAPNHFLIDMSGTTIDRDYEMGVSVGEDIGYQNGYQDGQTLGYTIGLEDGKSIGYNNGYEVGYEAGSTGLTNNPFNIISNAFNAVASILDIQILPNLSLGLLVFTPIIVTLIIVIVKMVRG